MARRKLPAPQRRAELVAAARRLFASRGFANTTVSEIVQETGVAQGTFYWHFASKDEILRAVASDIVDENTQAMAKIMALPGAGPVERLCGLAEVFANYVEQEQSFLARFHHPQNRELHDEVNQEAYGRMIPAIQAVLEQGVAEGVFDVTSTEAAAGFIIAASQVVTERGLYGQHESSPRLAAALVTFVLKGLGYRPATSTLSTPAAPEGNERIGVRAAAR
jgi:AcrR family transcriptional regulator